MRALRREDGISTLELGLVLPVLLLLMTLVIPLVMGGWKYMVVSRASAHGIRYATRVDTNAHVSSEGHLTRRPTAAEVEAFVRDAAAPLELTSVSVAPEPVTTLSGDLISLETRYVVSFGPVAGLANAVKTSLFGGSDILPESKQITVSARGREE